MNGINKRIVVLRDIHSNLIEEAILILKCEPGSDTAGTKEAAGQKAAMEKDFLLKEAQAIINNYVEFARKQESKTSRPGRRKKTLKSHFATNLIINTALAGSILLLVFFISKLL